jgi:heme exporter protein B
MVRRNMERNHPKVSKVPMAGRRYFQAIIAIIKKDLTAELRSRELISAMLIFSLLVILIFNFALELEPKLRLVVTPGILWVTFIFAGTIGLNRSLAVEKDRGSFDGLLLAPVDRSVILFGKMAGNLIFMFLLEILILPVYSLLYNVNLFQPGLLLVIFLGSVGYISVGTLLSSMSMQTKTRDMLLPIILFPVTIPILLAAVKASNGYLQNLGNASITPWINLLVVYDVIFLAVSYMVFDTIVEE